MALLDAYGRPMRTRQLTQRIAEPGLTGIRRAWADSTAAGLTPARLASILRAAAEGNLHDYVVLAEEMEERDPHYASVLGMRKRAISGVQPVVKPASDAADDKRIAEAVRERIAEHDGFADLVEDLLDALGKGFAVVEIDWRTTAREWWPDAFHHVDPRWLRFDRETGQELRLLDESDLSDGIPLEPGKFLQHRTRLKSGLPIRGGLARLVAFTWICKSYTTKDWIAFIETYGLPLRLGRYGPGAKPEDIDVLFRAVANIGSDAAAVLPESMRIDFEDAASGQGNEIFEKLARWCDEQISKAVLGQTMTADSGSSMAQAKVHNDVRIDIAQSDARAVSGVLNRDLVRPFVDLNFGVQRHYPRVAIEVEEPEDVDLIMRNVFRLVNVGLKVPAGPVRQKLKLPDPVEGDEIIGGGQSSPPQDDPARAANRTELSDPAEELDDIERAMAEDWQEVLDPVIGPVLARIEAAESYEAAAQIIREAFPAMQSAAMIETLVKAAFKARAIGEARDG